MERGVYRVNEALRVPPAGAALGAEEATAALGAGRFGRTGGAAYSSLGGADGAGAAAVVDAAMTCAAGNVTLLKGTLGLPAPATWYKAFATRGVAEDEVPAEDEIPAEDVVDAGGDPA